MGSLTPLGAGETWGDAMWFNPSRGAWVLGGLVVAFGSWGPKVENWPVAVIWASKALFGMLGSEPLADFNPTWLWRGILVIMTMKFFGS